MPKAVKISYESKVCLRQGYKIDEVTIYDHEGSYFVDPGWARGEFILIVSANYFHKEFEFVGEENSKAMVEIRRKPVVFYGHPDDWSSSKTVEFKTMVHESEEYLQHYFGLMTNDPTPRHPTLF